MKKRHWFLFLVVVTLSACNPPLTPTAFHPTATALPSLTPSPVSSTNVECAFQWAQQELPELTTLLKQNLETVEQPNAEVRAYAFGENCIHADGQVNFLAKETDFDLALMVANPEDESELGDWIVKVMQVIKALPADQLKGSGPSRLSIEFVADDQKNNLTFFTNQYEALEPGLSSAEIFQKLKTPQ